MSFINNCFSVETLLVVSMSIALNETFTPEYADLSTPKSEILAERFESTVS